MRVAIATALLWLSACLPAPTPRASSCVNTHVQADYEVHTLDCNGVFLERCGVYWGSCICTDPEGLSMLVHDTRRCFSDAMYPRK